MIILKVIILILACIPSCFPMNFYAKLGLVSLKTRFEDIIDRSAQNTECARHLKQLLSDLFSGQQWALKMIDASAKLNTGLMKGNFLHMGNYDECLEIEKYDGNSTISGQFCNIIATPSKNLEKNDPFVKNLGEIIQALRLEVPINPLYEYGESINKVPIGICLPKSCTIGNLQSIWNYAEISLGLKIHVKFENMLCDFIGKPQPNTFIDVYIWIFLATYFLTLLAATSYDYFITRRASSGDSVITAFSLYTNWKKLFSTHSNNNHICCINGIKVLSAIWVIIGHRYFSNILFAPANPFDGLKWIKKTWPMVILSGLMAVDTFFFLSGFLLTYVFYSYKKNGIEITIPKLYAARIFRLTPPLFFMIIFYIGIWKYLSTGPFWKPLAHIVSGICLQKWWSTLLYLDNIFGQTKGCVAHGWFLAVDTQLHLISPLILFSLYPKPKKTITMITFVIILSSVYSYIITIQRNLGATITEMSTHYFKEYYTNTFTRMPPWLIGIIFGYLVVNYKLEGKKFQMSKIGSIVLWFLSIGTILFIIFPCNRSFSLEKQYNPYKSALFNALARPVWGLSLGWIVFSCSVGYGGWINQFLSMPIFNMLGKLTYSSYLTHVGVIVFKSASRRTNSFFSDLDCFYDICGDLVLTFIVSVVLTLVMESPILALAKIYLKSEIEKKGVTTGTKINAKKEKKKSKKQIIFCVLDKDLKISNIEPVYKKLN